MTRTIFHTYLFLTLVTPLLAARPNVILIVTDDQGYGDMACHGNPWLKTPKLDQMRSESVRLEDYHVDPVCTPTRAALMTGRYSLRVGAWAVTEGRQLLNPDETTMAELFARSGYRTGMFGKWHLGDTFPYAPRFRGFQDVVCHRAGGIDEIGNPEGNSFFDDTLFRDGRAEKFDGYCTDIFFSEAIRFVGEQRGAPFFVYLPLNAMHGPFTVAGRYSERFTAMGHPEERAKFYGMIENFDENLGRLFGVLEEAGIEQDTIVIFMGDNGTAAGIGRGGSVEGFNAGMRGKKGSVYEGGHRVACFVRWPGQLEAGLGVEQLTSNHDWLPTLAELCELQVSQELHLDGRSLAPLLRGENVDWPDRTIVIDRQAGSPVVAPVIPDLGKKYPQYAVLGERWRLVNGELYDIFEDPGQRRDVAKQNPGTVDELYATYEQHFADAAAHNGAYTRFQLGAEQEPSSTLTVRDWHPTEGAVIWKKQQLGDDSITINGFWAVDIRKAGRYRFVLTRHPPDELRAIGADRVRIRIGGVAREKNLDPDDERAIFEFDLAQGEAILETCFTDAQSGAERGAYFVTASISPDEAFQVYAPDRRARQLMCVAVNASAGGVSVIRQEPLELPFAPGGTAMHPDGKHLIVSSAGGEESLAASVEILEGGGLRLANTSPLARPTGYTSVDRSGNFFLTAHYRSGAVAVYPIREGCSLGEAVCLMQAPRKEAHCLLTTPDNRFAYIPCVKNNNALFQFSFGEQTGVLTPLDPFDAEPPASFGPRHVAYHPTLPIAYFSNEQQLGVSVYEIGADGQLDDRQHAGTMLRRSPYQQGRRGMSASDLVLSPDGERLFVAIRDSLADEDSVFTFRVEEDGRLNQIARTKVGDIPWKLDLSPSGNYLLVSQTTDGELGVFEIQPDGSLSLAASYTWGAAVRDMSVSGLRPGG